MSDSSNFFLLASTNQSGASWATNPDATVALPSGTPTAHMLFNKHANAIVEYSYDGVNLAGELDPVDGTRGKAFDRRRLSKLWLRIKTGSTGPAIVSIEAWVVSL